MRIWLHPWAFLNQTTGNRELTHVHGAIQSQETGNLIANVELGLCESEDESGIVRAEAIGRLFAAAPAFAWIAHDLLAGKDVKKLKARAAALLGGLE